MKRVLSLALVLVMVLALLPISAFADTVASGTCGDNLTWTLDGEGILTISGTGAMYNYSTTDSVPWHSNRSDILSIRIKDGVTSIGETVFANCSSLISISIPNSVTSIGDYAFCNCDNLTSISIPNSVTSIGDCAFFWCDNLRSISIPDSVTSIGSGAFSDCPSLRSISIPDSVTSIGGFAFCSCFNLTSISVASSNPKYASDNGVLFNKNKSTLLCYPAGKSGTSYAIPNSVTSIGVGAFYDCSSLISISIPNSVTSIGDVAFDACLSLRSISIPNSVTYIGDYAFEWCDSLTSISLPDSVTSIGEGTFHVCDSLTDVYYNGSKYQWNLITIGIDNECLTNADIHYNSMDPGTKKAIIVVPGITGSELYDLDKGKRYWAADEFGLNMSTIDTVYAMLGKLYCDKYGNPKNNTIGIVNEQVSPYGTQETYKNLITKLRSTYDSDYGGNGEYDVRFFSYDWRLTNTQSAKALDKFIKDNGYDEVVLVAHSMGGIVASYCTGVIDSDYYVVDKLITLGTPYLGAPKAFGAFTTGTFIDNAMARPFVKNLAQNNICGLFQLLPNSRYFGGDSGYKNYYLEFKTLGGGYLDYTRSSNFIKSNYKQSYLEDKVVSGWYNDTLFTQAENLYKTLNSVYDKMIAGDINFYGIVGYNVNTIEGYSIIPESNLFSDYYEITNLDLDKYGDGTVPLASSTMGYADMARDLYYVNGTNHNDLVKKDYSIQLVCNIIDGMGDTAHYSEGCSGKIARSAGNVKTISGYKVITACPVDLSFYDKSGELIGTITPDTTITDEEHEFDLYVCGNDNRIKIAYLDDADIVIKGTDSGVMDLRIEKLDDGETTDETAYIDVPITENTVITTSAALGNSAQLKIDENGDGVSEIIIKPNEKHNTGHNVIHVAAEEGSCTEESCREYWYCKDCGRYYEDADCKLETKHDFVTVPAPGHDYKAVVTRPTCTEKGYTTHTCKVCGYSYKDSYVNATGHNTELKNGKSATCAVAGYSGDKICKTCGITVEKGKSIAPISHNYKDGVCTRCGTKDTSYKPVNPFVDVSESSVYCDAILWAYYHKPQQITGGFDATHFKPQNPCTRGQVVTFLWRAAGCPEPKGSNPFADVQNSGSCKPYYKAILWAAEKGITTGVDANHFQPSATVTRAQFVTFLWRYEDNPTTKGSISGFNDASSIAKPFQTAVAWAVEKGITTGYSDKTFRPNDTCTRWAVVLFMYRDMA